MKKKLISSCVTGLFFITMAGTANAYEVLSCDFEFGIP